MAPGPPGSVAGTKGSASAGRRVSPERTGQTRPGPTRKDPGVDCWAEPVISKPDIALG